MSSNLIDSSQSGSTMISNAVASYYNTLVRPGPLSLTIQSGSFTASGQKYPSVWPIKLCFDATLVGAAGLKAKLLAWLDSQGLGASPLYVAMNASTSALFVGAMGFQSAVGLSNDVELYVFDLDGNAIRTDSFKKEVYPSAVKTSPIPAMFSEYSAPVGLTSIMLDGFLILTDFGT